ncbi:hypothetical protein [Glutamicibacter nicotianae]|uniref:hypothetical protein n=1 Tax=Glutamicibacter nicotianae TaxID=37929 RepID=UPI00167FC96F|nr:hypothetical protein [Glutamicibacter nicotianae]
MAAELEELTVSAASEKKLRDAMERLLTGRPERTDGRLIKENLYKEAGVSRATMNRAANILVEWENKSAGPRPRDRIIEQLKEAERKHTTTIKNLRQKIRMLESQLTATSTTIGELYVENQILRDNDTTRNVSPLRQNVSKSPRPR